MSKIDDIINDSIPFIIGIFVGIIIINLISNSDIQSSKKEADNSSNVNIMSVGKREIELSKNQIIQLNQSKQGILDNMIIIKVDGNKNNRPIYFDERIQIPRIFYPPKCDLDMQFYKSEKKVCFSPVDFAGEIKVDSNSMSPILLKGHKYYGRNPSLPNINLGDILVAEKFGQQIIHALMGLNGNDAKIQGWNEDTHEEVYTSDFLGEICGVSW